MRPTIQARLSGCMVDLQGAIGICCMRLILRDLRPFQKTPPGVLRRLCGGLRRLLSEISSFYQLNLFMLNGELAKGKHPKKKNEK